MGRKRWRLKRMYWSMGGVVVLVGLWLLISRFVDEAVPNSSTTKDAATASSELSKVTPAAVGAKREPGPAGGREPVQQVNALYALAAPAPIEAAPVVESPEDLSIVEQVTLLRKPVVDAIRVLAVSKAEKYDRMRDALHSSGDSTEVWTQQAPNVFAGWGRELEGKGNGELDAKSVRCYLAGCESLVYFESEAAYETAAVAFRSLSEENAAHGGRVQTPPKQLEDGRWVAAWLMMRPNVGVE